MMPLSSKPEEFLNSLAVSLVLDSHEKDEVQHDTSGRTINGVRQEFVRRDGFPNLGDSLDLCRTRIE